MATATKPMTFKKQVFAQLKDEVSIITPIIGFNDEGHLTGLALSRKELVALMNNKETKGVIATDTTFGAVGFHFKSKVSTSEDGLTPWTDVVGFVYQSTDTSTLESVTKNDEFVNRFQQALAGANGIDAQIVPVNEIHVLKISVGGVIEFIFTQDMACVQTRNGAILIHGNGRDLYSSEVADLLCGTFNMSSADFDRTFLRAYGM
ncbi:hypothetical protein P9X10_02300 [Bacillus cereus]|nr:hypothetical protein [Bacillus cereus]